ncbi:MAG: bifunctional metallophosphatase/5'-nucleotidase [Chloroflexi bacterium]|nr:bifunctional metallophosphatase/5'-nucleotidase [Chloroflexota bacterium]
MRWRLIAALLALAVTIVPAVAAAAAGPPRSLRADFWLTILHNNDGESRLLHAGTGVEDYGGVARFETLVDRLKADALRGRQPFYRHGRKRGVLMLSSGDNFLAGAQFTASLEKGVPFYDSTAMDRIGYDAVAIGNHEFDFGPEVLADFIRGFDRPVTFVSANLDVSAEPELQALAERGRIAASVVVRESGSRIGIIGATTPGLPNISSPRNAAVDPEVAQAIQDEVDALEARGINKIILISHLQDVDEDIALAEELDGVDVIIAGGGDELLSNPGDPLVPGDVASATLPYPLVATDAGGTTVPVITTAGDYKYVGRLVAGFDRAGNVVAIDEGFSGPVRVSGVGPDAVPGDPGMEQQVTEPVGAFVASLASNVLANSEVTLNGKRGTVENGDITDPGIRNSETNEGNLTADSMLWQAQQLAADFGVDPPQVALQNSGGIRNNNELPPGPITELNTFEILAFTNFVSVKEDIPPAQFKAILETSVSVEGSGRFGQWAGVEFIYDVGNQPRMIDEDNCAVSDAGSRIVSASVNGIAIVSGGALVPGAPSIDLATNDFTFRGGDCYDFGPGGFTTLGVTYQQALANFLIAPTSAGGPGGEITAEQYPEGGEGRITRLE